MANPRAKITAGIDANFFERAAVINTEFGDVDGYANVLVNVRNVQHFSLVNQGSSVIEYSFNGFRVHGDLSPGTPTAAIFFDNRPVSKIWFRLVIAGTGSVRVEGWGS